MQIKITPTTMEAGDKLLFGGRLYDYSPVLKSAAGPYRFCCLDYTAPRSADFTEETSTQSFIEKIFDGEEMLDLIQAGKIFRPVLIQCLPEVPQTTDSTYTIVQDGVKSIIVFSNSQLDDNKKLLSLTEYVGREK